MWCESVLKIPVAGNISLTYCMQEVIVMHKGHEGIRQLPQPLFHQTCHCVDGIVFKADHVGLYRQHERKHYIFIQTDNQRVNDKRKGLTGLKSLVKFFHSVGRTGLPIDALGVEAVHLHVLQHHLQHHGHRVPIVDQVTHSHPKVLTSRLFVILGIQTNNRQIYWR